MSLTTRHTHTVIFGRKVVDCPRCLELVAGAPPIRWSVRHAMERNTQWVDALRRHRCAVSECGPVCTFGDW